ncbi:MAG: GbsR/MarR family transcriptional regulator [Candidatus Woesearchaeota archaeon]
MNTKLSNTEKEFIDRMGKISKRWGMSEPAGRVWGALLFSGTPLSQKEIAKKTGYGLSLVSPTLNIIEKLDMIKSMRGKNKEKLYQITTSFMQGFRILIKKFLEQDIKPLIEELESIKSVKNNSNLSNLISEYKQLEYYLDLFENMNFNKKCQNIK